MSASDFLKSQFATKARPTGDQFATMLDTAIPVVNVKDPGYDAKGDGVTDDAGAIQDAIDAAAVNRGIVFLPPGTYRLTTGLTINTSGVSLVGSGALTTTLNVDAVTGYAITVAGSGTGSANHINAVHLSGMTIRQTDRAAGAADGITLNYVSHCALSDIRCIELKGIALHAKEAWDCTLYYAHLLLCGDATATKPTVHYESHTPADRLTSTNEFDHFRLNVEKNDHIAVRLQDAEQIRFFGGKLHADATSPPAFPLVRNEGGRRNAWIGMQFGPSGAAHIEFQQGDAGAVEPRADGCHVIGCFLNSSQAWSIDIIDAVRTVIDGNSFGVIAKNTSGSLRVQAGADNTWGVNTVRDDIAVQDSSGLLRSNGYGITDLTHFVKNQVAFRVATRDASPANFDASNWAMALNNAAGNEIDYVVLRAQARDVTAGSEDADLTILLQSGGSQTNALKLIGSAARTELYHDVELVGGKYLEFNERSDPSAPGSNKGRLFCRDNGGKTQLAIRFPSGAVQVIATEP